jgi:drug/metabolite transporter (DMT)-like permease
MSKKLSWPVAFTALTLIWGASFLFIAVSGNLLPPVGVAFWRMVLGAAALFVIIKIQGHKLPKVGKAWLHTVIAGLFMSSIPFTLFAFGELHIASGLAGMINAATPVMTVLVILVAFRDQTPTRTQVIGLSIGILGTLVLLGVWNGFGENDPISVIALLGATLCYGIGSPYIRKFVSPLGMPNTVAVFMQLFTSSLTLLPFYLAGPITTGAANWANLGSILTLGVVGTGIAYILYYRVIDEAGTTIASSVTITQPVVAVILGMLLLAEHINWYEVVGGLVIIFGALVAQGRVKFIK